MKITLTLDLNEDQLKAVRWEIENFRGDISFQDLARVYILEAAIEAAEDDILQAGFRALAQCEDFIRDWDWCDQDRDGVERVCDHFIEHYANPSVWETDADGHHRRTH